jgi:hypothetical protein
MLGIAAHQSAGVAPNAAFNLGSRVGVFPFHWSHLEVLLLEEMLERR